MILLEIHEIAERSGNLAELKKKIGGGDAR